MAMAYTRIEYRACEFCGRDTPHSVERVGRVTWEVALSVPIVKNLVTCTCCGAIHTEKRIIVAK
jgi:uncharacterized Zn finger protein